MVEFDASKIVYTAELQEIARDVVLLDARAAPRFRGENETIDPVAGHIPGARNRPFADNLRPDGRFKPANELRAEFSAILGDSPAEAVIHSCGSGVTACHNLLAMEHAGLAGSRVYAPSWSGWISDGTRPVATGAA
jgi:thiosulfate/3-mercaptopyruvate sulfurtransferase